MTLTYRNTSGSVEIDPISRIEGHLGIKVTANGGNITEAKAHGNLFRGFENFLIGRAPNDAITFTQRICGVCPVPHGHTSTMAIDNVMGYTSKGYYTWNTSAMSGGEGIPKAALHIRNLVLGSEFLMSSITHFYHLAAPSYIQGPAVPPWTPYFNDYHYHPLMKSTASGGTKPSSMNDVGPYTADRRGVVPAKSNGFSSGLWDTVIRSYVKALRIRRLALEAGALFAGRMPMTSCYTAGGVTNYFAPSSGDLQARCDKFKTIMKEVGDFIVKEYVPIALVLGALYPNYDNQTNAGVANTVSRTGLAGTLWSLGNFSNRSGVDATNTGWGAGLGKYLSWGAFPLVSGTLALKGGFQNRTGGTDSQTWISSVSDLSTAKSTVENGLREWITSSRYTFHQANLFPLSASTGAVAMSGGSYVPTFTNRSASTCIKPTGLTVKPSASSSTVYVQGTDYTLSGATIDGVTKFKVKRTTSGAILSDTAALWIGYKWAKVGGTMAYPGHADRTEPLKTSGYTWLKAPRWKGWSAEVGPMARMVNAGFASTSGTAYATSYAAAGYGSYVKSGGLNPSMVEPDLAVALVREGLATLYSNGTTYNNTSLSATTGAAETTILNAYIHSTARIHGITATWITSIVGGRSTMDRLRHRALESLWLVQQMIGGVSIGATGTYQGTLNWDESGWVGLLKNIGGTDATTYSHLATPSVQTSGFGVSEAPRGALAHFCTINGGKISAYQCVVPTTWNGSPTVTTNQGVTKGAIEAAVIGAPYADLKSKMRGLGATSVGATAAYGGVEALRIAQSFDPCIACAVH